MKLEDLAIGIRVEGLIPHEAVQIVGVIPHGANAVEVYFKFSSGAVDQRVVVRSQEDSLSIAASGSRPFDADAADFKLVAEAQRITLAGLAEPMLAVATSNVQPVPHQIHAVYGELLPRTPLRFLLADDPGAGKTIMAGLYIKELILREDVQRCLIVAPGGLVDQWQDELFFKFGLAFDILTPQFVEAGINTNVFEKHSLLIARMDQLARSEELRTLLRETHWDLSVVDEAHRMGAHYFGTKLDKTKRFQLGELLGEISRHFLLMTATPHSGKEEDFQLFLSLLDKDRFAGKRTTPVETRDIMRRMVKEDLLTFEGRALFPERVAESIPYELTEDEIELYDKVTEYVRNGMNRAAALLDGKRKATVGFALTVLQRRLASSPEAILKSLLRRADRLESTKQAIADGTYTRERFAAAPAEVDDEESSAAQVESYEESVLDAATAAESIAELESEILELRSLAATAQALRESGQDKKWSEMSQILRDNVIPPDGQGRPRKLIIFTEHRDTLTYLAERIGKLLGTTEKVVTIHGGVSRSQRRAITDEFTKNPACQVMVATDAAGEGINLQAAHLMVNYDLPWNPNRIEQRFGRIHRIGQTEVCRLWNLVAGNTREGEVFSRLLLKINEQRQAYGGKVFDVLGSAFADTTLRDLLIEAIRYGDSPEVKARLNAIIDREVSEGLKELMEQQALAACGLSQGDMASLRVSMGEARARRLQPHYVELAFKKGFERFGGRMVRRENRRYEVVSVPAALRNSTTGPVASRYDRVTFDLDAVQPEGLARADLLAPGHPLHDAVMGHTVSALEGVLNRGTVLVSQAVEHPQVLVGVVEEVVDGTSQTVAHRFGYAYVRENGDVVDAGWAPYLDCAAAPDTPELQELTRLPWLQNAESGAVSWIVEHHLSDFLDEVTPPRVAELDKQRELVVSRLQSERDRLQLELSRATSLENSGERPRESSTSLASKVDALEARLRSRLELIDSQRQLATKPPVVVTSALVLPAGRLGTGVGGVGVSRRPAYNDTRRLALESVVESERMLGREAEVKPDGHQGYQILSTDSATRDTYVIALKTSTNTASDNQPLSVWFTHTEVLTAKNAAPRYRLVLVADDPIQPGSVELRYFDYPFRRVTLSDFDSSGHREDWDRLWEQGRKPF